MNRLTRATGPRFRQVRLGLLCGLLAAALTGALANPALANGRDHRHMSHRRARHYRPPPRYVGPSYQGYYQQPNVYYSAPPVVYQPQGPSINFSIPLFR
ncbi:MAG: hypothetical protein ACREFY_10340 [Acetobacteraceae bacterium]